MAQEESHVVTLVEGWRRVQDQKEDENVLYEEDCYHDEVAIYELRIKHLIEQFVV